MSDEQGSATVWMVTAIAVVVAATGAVVSVGAAIVCRHRAAVAADAAALAVAGDVVEGASVACAHGREIATANRAALTRCRLDGPYATVSVSVRPPAPLGRWGAAVVEARAGP